MDCKVCGLSVNAKMGGNTWMVLCAGCYHELHKVRSEMLDGNEMTWEDLTKEALVEVKERFRKGKTKPSLVCSCCNENVHAYANVGVVHALDLKLCTSCYLKVHKIWLGSDLGFEEILDTVKAQNGKRRTAEIVYEKLTSESVHDAETLDIIKVNKQPLSSEEYHAMEYSISNAEVIEGFGYEDEKRRLTQLFDMALLVKDMQWLKEIYTQLQGLEKGRNVQ